MKKKIWISLFVISVIPFFLALVTGINAAINGIPASFFGGSRYYGFEAFIDSILLFSWFVWPVYIVSLILIVISVIKLRKIKKNGKA